ncbi:MAG: UbiA family prenyltransferase [Chloroflexales bacterium]|nr:UbiA family prenyltransferase [Chloroflexales bacterium]
MVASGARTQAAGLFQVTRFTNSLYAGAYTLVGAYLAGGLTGALSASPLLAAIVVGLVIAFGFVINDYVDVEVDTLAKPYRPIPAGTLARRDALAFAAALAGLAMAAAVLLGPTMALIAAATIGIAALYSFALKATVLVGNACMGLLIATMPLYGALAAGGVTSAVWVVAGLMWLFDFSHEVLKTTADHVGDRAAGLSTVATALGVPGAVRVFQLIALLFCAVALLPWPLGLASWAYAIAMLLCALLPILGIIALLARSTDDATITLALKVMRYLWITSLLPTLLLR